MPFYNGVGISEEEWTSFKENVKRHCDSWKDYLNRYVFSRGVDLPAWNIEFLTKSVTRHHALVIIADLFYNMPESDVFWDPYDPLPYDAFREREEEVDDTDFNPYD